MGVLSRVEPFCFEFCLSYLFSLSQRGQCTFTHHRALMLITTRSHEKVIQGLCSFSLHLWLAALNMVMHLLCGLC